MTRLSKICHLQIFRGTHSVSFAHVQPCVGLNIHDTRNLSTVVAIETQQPIIFRHRKSCRRIIRDTFRYQIFRKSNRTKTESVLECGPTKSIPCRRPYNLYAFCSRFIAHVYMSPALICVILQIPVPLHPPLQLSH